MASPVTEEAVGFKQAYSAYKTAWSDQERSAASALLRLELGRQSMSVAAALEREKGARAEEFKRAVAALEEQLRADMKAKDDAAAAKQAVVELCIEKMESDPAEAHLYCGVILSWATNSTPSINSCMDGSLRDQIREAVMGGLVHEHMNSPRRAARAAVRVGKMTPQELYRVTANVQRLLNKKDRFVPIKDLSEAISGSVKIEEVRRSEVKFWKETIGWIGVAGSVLSAAVTTVEAVKYMPVMDTDSVAEPLLNCRHFLPDGWFF